jgi:hypothetical protein
MILTQVPDLERGARGDSGCLRETWMHKDTQVAYTRITENKGPSYLPSSVFGKICKRSPRDRRLSIGGSARQFVVDHYFSPSCSIADGHRTSNPDTGQNINLFEIHSAGLA